MEMLYTDNYVLNGDEVTLYYSHITDEYEIPTVLTIGFSVANSISILDVLDLNLNAWTLGLPSLGIKPEQLVPCSVAFALKRRKEQPAALELKFGPTIGTLNGCSIPAYIEVNGNTLEFDGLATNTLADNTTLIDSGMRFTSVTGTPFASIRTALRKVIPYFIRNKFLGASSMFINTLGLVVYKSSPTVRGNVGVSNISQEDADEQAVLMDNNNCLDCTGCISCNKCTNCNYCTRCVGCANCDSCRACLGCADCSNCVDCRDCVSVSDRANQNCVQPSSN